MPMLSGITFKREGSRVNDIISCEDLTRLCQRASELNPHTHANVYLPAAHRNMLEADKLKVVDFDVARSNLPARVGVFLECARLHFLDQRRR